MGGYGSTRWYLHTKKHTVDEYHRLRIQDFDKVLLADVYTTGDKVYLADSPTDRLVGRRYG